jgi:hypothetical protein
MAVSHSSASESHTGTTGSTNESSFSWTHAQSGTPQGVVVFVHTQGTTDLVTGVTYGGVSLTRVTGGEAIDTAGEPARTDLFFLGSGLSSGNQTITVSRTSDTATMYASAATVLADRDVEAFGVDTRAENQAPTVIGIDDGSPGTDSLRYAAAYYGGASPAPAGTGSTLLTDIDLGPRGASMVRETTAGQGVRNVGFSGSSDDYAAVFLAIREPPITTRYILVS